MVLEFDHLAVCAENLRDGVDYVQDLLGVKMSSGGEHALMGTHNRLLSLGRSIYLEVIAINPDAPPPGRTRWFDLDVFAGPPRLTNWVARCDDLAVAIGRAPSGTGDILSLSRGDLRWSMAVPENGQLPYDGMFPGLINWGKTTHPATRLADVGCRLIGLTLAHPEIENLRGYLAPLSGAVLPQLAQGTGPKVSALIATPNGDRLLS